MPTINWALTKEEHLYAEIIADAACAIYNKGGAVVLTRERILEDITIVHNHILKLDFKAWSEAPSIFQFSHDIAGIVNYLDREKLELREFFMPRFAKKE